MSRHKEVLGRFRILPGVLVRGQPMGLAEQGRRRFPRLAARAAIPGSRGSRKLTSRSIATAVTTFATSCSRVLHKRALTIGVRCGDGLP